MHPVDSSPVLVYVTESDSDDDTKKRARVRRELFVSIPPSEQEFDREAMFLQCKRAQKTLKLLKALWKTPLDIPNIISIIQKGITPNSIHGEKALLQYAWEALADHPDKMKVIDCLMSAGCDINSALKPLVVNDNYSRIVEFLKDLYPTLTCREASIQLRNTSLFEYAVSKVSYLSRNTTHVLLLQALNNRAVNIAINLLGRITARDLFEKDFKEESFYTSIVAHENEHLIRAMLNIPDFFEWAIKGDNEEAATLYLKRDHNPQSGIGYGISKGEKYIELIIESSFIKDSFSCQLEFLTQCFMQKNETAFKYFIGAGFLNNDKFSENGVLISYLKEEVGSSFAQSIIYSTDNAHNTFLHHAAEWGDLSLARILLNLGANINAVNSSGCSPLFLAIVTLTKTLQLDKVKKRQLLIVVLISRGADLLQRSNLSLTTPLKLILESRLKNLAEIISHFDYRLRISVITKEPTFIIEYIKNAKLPLEIAELIERWEIADLLKLVAHLPRNENENILLILALFRNEASPLVFSGKINYDFINLLNSRGFVIRRGPTDQELVLCSSKNENIVSKKQIISYLLQGMTFTEAIIHLANAKPSRPSVNAATYKWDIIRAEISDAPLKILAYISKQFLETFADNLHVNFLKDDKTRELGVDAGGLSRQLINLLFSSLCKQDVLFKEIEGGLYKPHLSVVNISELTAHYFKVIGQLLMFSYNTGSSSPYRVKIGQFFPVGLFTFLKSTHPLSYLDIRDFDSSDDYIFREAFSLYKIVNSTTVSGKNDITNLENCLGANEQSSDELLLNLFSAIQCEPEIESANFNPTLENIKSSLPFLLKVFQKYIFENFIIPELLPLQLIRKGMKECYFTKRESFFDLCLKDPEEMSVALQGHVDPVFITQKQIEFNESIPESLREWIKNWILAADAPMLKSFMFAVTGSTSLGSRATIKVKKGSCISFSTCFLTLKVNPEFRSAEEFNERLEYALEHVKVSSEFTLD